MQRTCTPATKLAAAAPSMYRKLGFRLLNFHALSFAVAALTAVSAQAASASASASAQVAPQSLYDQIKQNTPPPPRNSKYNAANKSLFEQGCTQYKDAELCKEAAKYYLYADSENQDHASAFTWNQKGCELKHAESCLSVAGAYLRGSGVEKNPKLGLSFGDKACEYGLKSHSCNRSKTSSSSQTQTSLSPLQVAQNNFSNAFYAIKNSTGYQRLDSEQCGYLSRTAKNLNTTDAKRWLTLVDTWKAVPSHRRTGYYCDYVPKPLAAQINAEFNTNARSYNPNTPPTPSPYNAGYGSGYQNSSTMRQAWQQQNGTLKCRVSNGKRTCYTDGGTLR